MNNHNSKLSKKLTVFLRINSRYINLIYIGFILTIFFGNNLYSQELALPKHGIRSNVLWPVFPGGKFRFTYRGSIHDNLDWRTDILLGIGYSAPEQRNAEGRFTETSGILGFRQFFSSPWHFELQAAYGRSRLHNAVSPGLFNPQTLALLLEDTRYVLLDEVIRKRSYTSDDLEIMGSVGYEWRLGDNWSIDFQVGGAKVVNKSNPWPIYTNNNRTRLAKEQILPVGVVNITYWF